MQECENTEKKPYRTVPPHPLVIMLWNKDINSFVSSVSVLLRAVLGHHPLSSWPRVPQAAGEGGRGQAEDGAIQVVLSREGNIQGTAGRQFPPPPFAVSV